MAYVYAQGTTGTGPKFATEEYVVGMDTLEFPVCLIGFGADGGPFVLSSSSNPFPVTVISSASHAVTNAGTFAVQATAVASEVHVGQIGATSDVVDVALTLDTSIYASGDVLAATQAITNAVRVNGGTATLQSIQISDEDYQGIAFDLYILAVNNSMGTENLAPSISDANARDIQGRIRIATSDYTDLGGVKVAMPDFKPFVVKAASDSRDLYIAAVNGSGTPTFSATGLRLKLGFLQD